MVGRVQPTCRADGCGWTGDLYRSDATQDMRNAHRQADRHAEKHGDRNRPDWPRRRAGGPLVLVPLEA